MLEDMTARPTEGASRRASTLTDLGRPRTGYVCHTGLGPQFWQTILAHTRIHSTLDEYSHVGLDELKRRFAALDLADGPEVGGGGQGEARVLLERLRPLVRKGRSVPGRNSLYVQKWSFDAPPRRIKSRSRCLE